MVMEETDIRLSQIGIGKAQLDPAAIRGEGGEHDPRLVIPVKIELYQQPPEHQIIVTRLSATLHLGQSPSQSNQFASKVSYDSISNMRLLSLGSGPTTHDVELHFNLTHAQLKALENMRHEPGKNLYLHLEPVVAWNKDTGNSNDRSRDVSALAQSGWDGRVGMFSELIFFWLPTIGVLRLDLAAMDWAEKVFPGMGYDSFRLIEVKLPTSDVLVPGGAIEHFKEAKREYDRGLHPECSMKFRLAHEAIEKHLGVHAHELGKAVTKRLEWTPGSEQEKFLDGAWKSLYVIANASH